MTELEKFTIDATGPGSFYHANGGRFKNQRPKTPAEDRAYVRKLFAERKAVQSCSK